MPNASTNSGESERHPCPRGSLGWNDKVKKRSIPYNDPCCGFLTWPLLLISEVKQDADDKALAADGKSGSNSNHFADHSQCGKCDPKTSFVDRYIIAIYWAFHHPYNCHVSRPQRALRTD